MVFLLRAGVHVSRRPGLPFWLCANARTNMRRPECRRRSAALTTLGAAILALRRAIRSCHRMRGPFLFILPTRRDIGVGCLGECCSHRKQPRRAVVQRANRHIAKRAQHVSQCRLHMYSQQDDRRRWRAGPRPRVAPAEPLSSGPVASGHYAPRRGRDGLAARLVGREATRERRPYCLWLRRGAPAMGEGGLHGRGVQAAVEWLLLRV